MLDSSLLSTHNNNRQNLPLFFQIPSIIVDVDSSTLNNALKVHELHRHFLCCVPLILWLAKTNNKCDFPLPYGPINNVD